MTDVAVLAGLTKGAVYFHYVNKEALALAVSQEFYSRLRSIAATATTQATPMAALTEFLVKLAVAFQQEQVMQAGARLQIERGMIATALPEPYRDATAAIGGWLDEAAASDERMRAADPAAVARVLIAAIFGAQHISWVVSGREDILERMLEIIATMFPQCTAETEAAITSLPAPSRRRARRAQQRIRAAGQSPRRA
jgi:AcrR family transcriptional regulator